MRGKSSRETSGLKRGFTAMSAVLGAALICLLFPSASPAAETSPATNRVSVIMLPLRNMTGDTNADFWKAGITGLIESHLARTHQLFVMRNTVSDFASKRLALPNNGAIDPPLARKVGELVEARRVIWGGYARRDGSWEVSVRILNTANGVATSELKAASTNWFDIRDKIDQQILSELKIVPAEEERKKLVRRPTTSLPAYEAFCRADSLDAADRPQAEVIDFLREAIKFDPNFALAHLGLAATLFTGGKFEEAEAEVQEAVRLAPDNPDARMCLGTIRSQSGKRIEGEVDLREAASLDPDDPEIFIRLGEIYLDDNLPAKAIEYFLKAIELEPTRADAHANLGGAYAEKGDRSKALTELAEAENLSTGGVNTEQTLALGYIVLHDSPKALEHIERFVSLARGMQANPSLVEQFEESGRQIKATLTPQFLASPMPKVYTASLLQATIKEKLTKAELDLVLDPLKCTPKMKDWAQRLTAGATNDLDRAKKLYDGLSRHIDSGFGGSRTAEQVFALWNDGKTSFRCQEYARLYVALARSVGLNSFFVEVRKDCQTNDVLHVCAATFFSEKALLVDPTYHWFGAPHQKFLVMDDMQALACYLNQQNGDVTRARMAAKLDPNSAFVQFQFAGALVNDFCQTNQNQGQLPNSVLKAQEREEAKSALQKGLRLDPDSYLANYFKGMMALVEGNLIDGKVALEKACDQNPHFDKSNLFLAQILQQQGKLKEARDHYRSALDFAMEADWQPQARHAIAEINEQLGDK